jgi:flagellar motor protein MotB
MYTDSYKESNDGNFDFAIQFANGAISLEPRFVDAFLLRADIYAKLKRYELAIADFERAYQLDSIYSKPYLLTYAIYLAGAGKFDKALTATNKLLSYDQLSKEGIDAANLRKNSFLFALDYEKKHPVKNTLFNPENMGDSINSEFPEYFPSLTIEGDKIVFTRNVYRNEDFYESNLINGKWSKARPLEGEINTNLNEGAQNISQDGKILVFTGCNYVIGQGNCDLYISMKTEYGWTKAENLGPNVNSNLWESSPSLSSDKKDIYFASTMPGGFGGRDIWVIHRQTTGSWSRPENLGPSVNTSGNESCPFMHPDNETLYFNSDGLPGYGKTDLFFTKKLGDGRWKLAENLGYPINTIDAEATLVVGADSKTAFYATERAGGKGGMDLYTFQLKEGIRAVKTSWVKGRILDPKTGKPVKATVELVDLKTGKVVSVIETDEDGNYLTTLPQGRDYSFTVRKKGFLFYSDNFSLGADVEDFVHDKDINMEAIEPGASVVLNNIFFDSEQFTLKPESVSELDNVVSLLFDNDNLRIQISGHTDNTGSEILNQKLSLNRAKEVVYYLLNKGINPSRLEYKGYGASKPVKQNKTEAGKAANRRTELTVISNAVE